MASAIGHVTGCHLKRATPRGSKTDEIAAQLRTAAAEQGWI
jgi:hypothetical protein